MTPWLVSETTSWPGDVQHSSKHDHDPNLSDTLLDNQLKNYDINTAAGADLSKSVGPSAEFIQMPIAFNYR
jgi:general transcription factor 3C polypeptide 5 (transcription factor C subunit 1)